MFSNMRAPYYYILLTEINMAKILSDKKRFDDLMDKAAEVQASLYQRIIEDMIKNWNADKTFDALIVEHSGNESLAFMQFSDVLRVMKKMEQSLQSK